jgi:hypothetical protein
MMPSPINFVRREYFGCMATIADKIPDIAYAGWTYAERDLRDRFDTPTKETHLMTRVGFTIAVPNHHDESS